MSSELVSYPSRQQPGEIRLSLIVHLFSVLKALHFSLLMKPCTLPVIDIVYFIALSLIATTSTDACLIQHRYRFFQRSYSRLTTSHVSTDIQMRNIASTTLLDEKPKRLILVRHGRTHMNEYLASEGTKWGDYHFSDKFDDSVHHLYQDSPLSEKGLKQAQELYEYFSSEAEPLGGGKGLLSDIELVAVSPLSRALQTAQIGILPHFSDDSPGGATMAPSVPFVALPLASERVYLISDIGKPRAVLNEAFSFVDFDQEFDNFEKEWWFTVKDQANKSGDEKLGPGELSESDVEMVVHSFNYMYKKDYVEWRPTEGQQEYACLGEPDDAFHARMRALFRWIQSREESVICLVCHFGVIEWLIGEEFGNCEVRDVCFKKVEAHVSKMMQLSELN